MTGYVTTGRAAAELGVSASTLRNWVKSGLVKPAFRTPRRGDMRWDMADLHQQLRGLAQPSAIPAEARGKPPPMPDDDDAETKAYAAKIRARARPKASGPAGSSAPRT